MQIYNIPEHLRGDTFDGKVFAIQKNGLALDLTDAEIKMDVRRQGILHLRLKNDPGAGEGSITITDAVGGKFRIDPQIIDIPGTTYIYEIEILFPNDVNKTYVGGSWPIREDITHGR